MRSLAWATATPVAASAAIMLATGCAGLGFGHGGAPPGTPSARPAAATSGTATGLAGSAPRQHSGPSSPAPGHGNTRRPLPRFAAIVSGPLRPRNVPFSWHRGCPVAPRRLRAIRLSYVGFDGSAHTGEIIVNASVVKPVIKVFSILYRARFPIRRMVPVDAFHGSDQRSMAADNTSGFNCRLAVAPGPPQWSMHAYGLAIDVNTVQNPYIEPGIGVRPGAGAAYVNRSHLWPGMAYPGGTLVSAFRSIGWGWGGYWQGSPDYQHFSVNGR